MIIRLYLFWIIGLLFITVLGSRLLPLLPNSGLGAVSIDKPFNFFYSLAQWDGGIYLEIAKSGYHRDLLYAFFPLYPLLVKLVKHLFFNNELVSALLISNVSFVGFLLIFFRYIKEVSNNKIAKNTILTFLFFPTTFVCLLAYSESLFLFTTISSIYFLRKNRFYLSAFFAIFSTLTRLSGVFVALFTIFTKTKKIGISSLITFFAPLLTLLGYCFYLYLKTGDLLKFVSVQSLWQRDISDPISTLFFYFWAFVNLENRPINDYFEFTMTTAFIFVLVLGIKKIPQDLWFFSMIVILVPLFTGTLSSMPRYLLSSLGTFVVVGKYLEQKPNLKLPVWSISLAIQCFLASLFINGHWIT